MTPTNINNLRYTFPKSTQLALKRVLWALLLRFVLPVAIVAMAALWGAKSIGVTL